MRQVCVAALLAVVAIVSVLFFSATSANEGTLSLRATLTGFQESPPRLSAGSGTFTGTITGGTLTYTLKYSNLSSSAFMAHIHFGQRAVSGGILIWLCQSASAPSPTAGTPTCPAGGGTVTGTATAQSVIKVIAPGTGGQQTLMGGNFNDAIAIIKSGDAYANVHTTNFPAGEIRGQIQVESED